MLRALWLVVANTQSTNTWMTSRKFIFFVVFNNLARGFEATKKSSAGAVNKLIAGRPRAAEPNTHARKVGYDVSVRKPTRTGGGSFRRVRGLSFLTQY